MIPVDQEFFYQEEPRIYGDCTRAAIASILELPLSDVPHFLLEAKGDVYEYYDGIDEFLSLRGLEILWQVELEDHWRPGKPDVFHLICGQSPRFPNINHMVVGLNGKIIFDPHPDRTGLANEPKFWQYAFIKEIK